MAMGGLLWPQVTHPFVMDACFVVAKSFLPGTWDNGEKLDYTGPQGTQDCTVPALYRSPGWEGPPGLCHLHNSGWQLV